MNQTSNFSKIASSSVNENRDIAGKGITVRYIYSACVVITSPNVAILTDPWFTEGIYDGSWFHFPKVSDPIRLIGQVDAIYISHIHPDHYDPDFLRQYFAAYGEKPLLIADHSPNYLLSKMRAEGFQATVLKEPLSFGATNVTILPHKTGSISDIDSALIVEYHDGTRVHRVANANDIIFDDDMIRVFKTHALAADILLCGYTGAGPYPQTYFDLHDPALPLEAAKKKQSFFERYLKLVTAIDPKVVIPFAGQYILGGRLVGLNAYRGVADPVEVLELDSRAIVLDDDGGEISTSDFEPTRVRTAPYAQGILAAREREIADYPFDYERLISPNEIGQLPLKRLLRSAAKNAVAKSEVEEDYYFVIHLPNCELAILNAVRSESPQISFSAGQREPLPEPRSEIRIDPRYLFGLLTAVYHWNNAEVGSQFETRRFPNQFNSRAQSFLTFLHIS
jgi:UDP-MurNAc hydroxylase